MNLLRVCVKEGMHSPGHTGEDDGGDAAAVWEPSNVLAEDDNSA